MKARTIEGFSVPFLTVTHDHAWPCERLAFGFVYEGKRKVLGQGFWDADTGQELIHAGYPRSIDGWKLSSPIPREVQA